jgi:hypothetical protein
MRSKLRFNHKYMKCKYDKGKSGNLRLTWNFNYRKIHGNYMKILVSGGEVHE